jgi:hypothetical protein
MIGMMVEGTATTRLLMKALPIPLSVRTCR